MDNEEPLQNQINKQMQKVLEAAAEQIDYLHTQIHQLNKRMDILVSEFIKISDNKEKGAKTNGTTYSKNHH